MYVHVTSILIQLSAMFSNMKALKVGDTVYFEV